MTPACPTGTWRGSSEPAGCVFEPGARALSGVARAPSAWGVALSPATIRVAGTADHDRGTSTHMGSAHG
jgi:hypothetical protein